MSLVLDFIETNTQQVNLDDTDWIDKVRKGLAKGTAITLFAQNSKRNELSKAILNLISEPIEANFLHLYPVIESVKRAPNGLLVNLTIRETIQ